MLERIKRRLSRTKSVPEPPVEHGDFGRSLSLTPSDEMLISKLSFAQGIQSPRTRGGPPTLQQQADPNWSKRTVFNDVDRGFLSLPTELLEVLKPYLRDSSEVALRHTCSRFFYLYSLHSFYLTGDEKFDFVCMTERDQDPKQMDRLVCGHCRDIHPKGAFSSTQITKPPLERDCRQIWACPHKHLGYKGTIKAIKAGAEAPFRAEKIDPCSRCREWIRSRSVADRPEKGTSTIDLESPKSASLLITKIAIMQRPLPEQNTRVLNGGSTYKEVFGIREVSAALQAINFRICQHITLGDPVILSKFCRSCTNTQRLPPGAKGPPCISNWNKNEADKGATKCKGMCFDRQCKTKFMFQTRESLQPDASGRRQVWLFIAIYRWLGPLLSIGPETYWREHAIKHEERKTMRANWEKWERANRNSQLMPNWSISLLHPEDSNLR